MKKRMFSIPYNGINVDEYLQLIEPYKEHIDNIFFGASWITDNHISTVRSGMNSVQTETYNDNTKEFLIKSKGKYKRILTINLGGNPLDDTEIYQFTTKKLFPFIDYYYIDGVIITDFNLGKAIRQNYPNIEIHTSCNCFQWNIRQMQIWQEEIGINVFNPPREILRTPDKLKEMKEHGFKLKCLINEGCLYGCPQTINHAVSLSTKEICTICNRNKLENSLRGNFIVPKWYKYLDDYVDIYKISGRLAETDYLQKVLDCYINEKDYKLRDIVMGSNTENFNLFNINIMSSELPDKLLFCKCEHCDTCNFCEKFLHEYFGTKQKIYVTVSKLQEFISQLGRYKQKYFSDVTVEVYIVMDSTVNLTELQSQFEVLHTFEDNNFHVYIDESEHSLTECLKEV